MSDITKHTPSGTLLVCQSRDYVGIEYGEVVRLSSIPQDVKGLMIVDKSNGGWVYTKDFELLSTVHSNNL